MGLYVVSQFLIIWAGNLPEEIPWYIRRFSGGWGYIGWFIAIFHFCVPFFLLLMRFVKKNPKLLYWVCDLHDLRSVSSTYSGS